MPSPFLQQDIEDYERSAQRYNRSMERWNNRNIGQDGQSLGVFQGHVSLHDAKATPMEQSEQSGPGYTDTNNLQRGLKVGSNMVASYYAPWARPAFTGVQSVMRRAGGGVENLFHRRDKTAPDYRPDARSALHTQDSEGNDITVLQRGIQAVDAPDAFKERDPTESMTVNQIKELQSPKAKAPGLIARMLKS